MKRIEKKGSIYQKRISAEPKGIVAIKASIGAIRKNAFESGKPSCTIFSSAKFGVEMEEGYLSSQRHVGLKPRGR